MSNEMGRREIMKRAGLVAAGTTALVAGGGAVAKASTDKSASAPADTATVTASTGAAGVFEVVTDSPNGKATSHHVRNGMPNRQLHPGDRVVLSADPKTGTSTALPLFLSLTGPVTNLSKNAFTVQGRTVLIDDQSLVCETDKQQVKQLGKLRGSRHVRERTSVGVLCVENRAEHTLTADVLYVFK
jgi:ribosomal protein L21E